MTMPAGGADRLVPEPWLVSFGPTGNDPSVNNAWAPVLQPGTDFDYVPTSSQQVFLEGKSDRVLRSSFARIPTLRFFCNSAVGRLLPVGSYVIPAVNNDFGPIPKPTDPVADVRYVGFIPHSPEQMPIWRVVDRPDENTVVVESNGVYPWVAPGVPPQLFLCWVVPPAFTQRDGAGQPIFEDRSPILSLTRRVIRVPEIR
jgi:hypothetical protein